MRRTLSFAAAWLAVAVVALVVAWQGVSVVADQVTNRRPAPLGAEEVRRQLELEAAAAAVPTTGVTPTTVTTGAPPVTSTSVPAIAATSAPPATAPPTTAAPAPAPTEARATTAPPPASETRTYNLVGGSAASSFSPAGVSVVFAVPEPGFEVDVEPESGNGVRVEFDSEDHRSRVDAWWDGGPQERVREEPD